MRAKCRLLATPSFRSSVQPVRRKCGRPFTTLEVWSLPRTCELNRRAERWYPSAVATAVLTTRPRQHAAAAHETAGPTTAPRRERCASNSSQPDRGVRRCGSSGSFIVNRLHRIIRIAKSSLHFGVIKTIASPAGDATRGWRFRDAVAVETSACGILAEVGTPANAVWEYFRTMSIAAVEPDDRANRMFSRDEDAAVVASGENRNRIRFNWIVAGCLTQPCRRRRVRHMPAAASERGLRPRQWPAGDQPDDARWLACGSSTHCCRSLAPSDNGRHGQPAW